MFVVVLGYVVYRGMKSVDYVNRGLMFGKLLVYLILVLMIAPFIQETKLQGGEAKFIAGN